MVNDQIILYILGGLNMKLTDKIVIGNEGDGNK